MKKLSNKDLEQLECSYLKTIFKCLNKDNFLSLLNSKEKIRKHWNSYWNQNTKKISTLNTGAERVVSFLMPRSPQFKPNSTPVGSDIVFETNNAFIHLDIKTYIETNIGDFNYKITIGNNQTSYKTNFIVKNKKRDKRESTPQLPDYYKTEDGNKPCLTYFISILHKDLDQNKTDDKNILCIILSSCPNGQLREIRR